MRYRGGVYQPTKGSAYQYTWTHKGKRHRGSTGVYDYEAALHFLDEYRKAVLIGATLQAPVPTTLGAFITHHVAKREEAKKVTSDWLTANEAYLARAQEFFGTERQLGSIDAPDVGAWSAKLLDAYAPNTVLHHLNALSNLFKRARAEKAVPKGHNPVKDFDEKPEDPKHEARWLEVHDAALLLEAARRYKPAPAFEGGRPTLPFLYPLIATCLLTGGREAEVLGLEVSDISFDRKTVTFRPNTWRRLKTKRSARVVPLWPQLEEILRPYVFADRAPGKLLFPSPFAANEQMVTNWTKGLDAVAERAGWKQGEIRSKMFRHTYITTRLQTLDHGAPVALWTVAREVGHSSPSMIEDVYGHLGQVRHRAEAVEYRVEQHQAKLEDRLAGLALSI